MEAKKTGEEDLKMHQIRQLLAQLDEEKRQVERLKLSMKDHERSYKAKLLTFAKELEGVSIRKSKSKETLYEAGISMKSTLNTLHDLIRS